MSTIALTFQNTQFDIVDRNCQPWLRSPQIAVALGYNRSDRVNEVYARNSNEFTDTMTALVELDTEGGKQQVRIFSLRGCHLLGMLSKTKIAKQFRVWVLDILEKQHIQSQSQQATPPRYRSTKHLTQEVITAINRRAHALSVSQYEKIKAQLHTAIIDYSGDLRGEELVDYINCTEFPTSLSINLGPSVDGQTERYYVHQTNNMTMIQKLDTDMLLQLTRQSLERDGYLVIKKSEMSRLLGL